MAAMLVSVVAFQGQNFPSFLRTFYNLRLVAYLLFLQPDKTVFLHKDYEF